MKKICFLGNSHIASIKLGLKKMSAAELDQLDLHFDIFGSPARTLATCYIDDGLLTSNDVQTRENFKWTSGGKLGVPLEDYDTIVVLAGASVFSPDLFWSHPAPIEMFDLPLHSEAVIDEVLEVLGRNWAVSLSRLISSADVTQVLHIGCPFVSDAAPLSKVVTSYLDKAEPETAEYLESIKDRLVKHAKEMETPSLHFLPPPASVLERHGVYTKDIYSRQSMKLTRNLMAEHPQDDFIHMNGIYGAALISHVAQALS